MCVCRLSQSPEPADLLSTSWIPRVCCNASLNKDKAFCMLISSSGEGPYPSAHSRCCLILEIAVPWNISITWCTAHFTWSLYKSQQLCVLACTSMVRLSGRSQTLRFRYLDVANYMGTSCLNFVMLSGNLTKAADRLPAALSSSSHPQTAACMRSSNLCWVCLMPLEHPAWCPTEAWRVMGLLCNVCNIRHLHAVLPGVLWHVQWHLVSTFGKWVKKFIFSD